MDLVKEEIASDRLSVPLSSTRPPNDPDTELFVLDLIQERVTAAEGDVVVLVDACVIRHHCRNEVLDLLKRTGFPVYGTPMGKTAIEENYKRYGGVSFIPSFVIRDHSNCFRFILAPCPTPVSGRKWRTPTSSYPLVSCPLISIPETSHMRSRRSATSKWVDLPATPYKN
jgi:hypothetical protein